MQNLFEVPVYLKLEDARTNTPVVLAPSAIASIVPYDLFLYVGPKYKGRDSDGTKIVLKGDQGETFVVFEPLCEVLSMIDQVGKRMKVNPQDNYIVGRWGSDCTIGRNKTFITDMRDLRLKVNEIRVGMAEHPMVPPELRENPFSYEEVVSAYLGSVMRPRAVENPYYGQDIVTILFAKRRRQIASNADRLEAGEGYEANIKAAFAALDQYAALEA